MNIGFLNVSCMGKRGAVMNKDRMEKTLVMINSTANPEKKRYSVITFEDEDGNKYEYNLAGTMDEKTKSKFYQSVAQYEYFPLLQAVKDKPKINVSFRMGKAKMNPVTGKYIYQMLYPTFHGIADNIKNIVQK